MAIPDEVYADIIVNINGKAMFIVPACYLITFRTEFITLTNQF